MEGGPQHREDQEGEEDDQKKKKKKKTKLPKEERLRRREEAALRQMYQPKDTHVNVLNPEVFNKLKGTSNSNRPNASIPVAAFHFTPPPPAASTPMHIVSVSEFPTLGAPVDKGSRAFKSFAAAAAVPVPVVYRTRTASSSSSTETSLRREEVVSPKSGTSQESSEPSAPVAKGRLSKRPITISIGDLFKPAKPKNAVANKQIAKKLRHDKLSVVRENPKLTMGNLLDASGPSLMLRGKIKRKKKRLSKLKKLIFQSRESRKSTLPDIAIKLHTIIDSETALEHRTPAEECSCSSTTGNVDVPATGKGNVPEPGVRTRTPEASCSVLESISDLRGSLPSDKTKCSSADNNVFGVLLDRAEESAKRPPPVPEDVIQLVKVQMHSRKFRPYCDMFVDKELHGLVIPMMGELHRLQDRIYKTDPAKLQTKRRYVNGIKEVLTALRLKKVQMVIMAPDIEPSDAKGGLDEKITEIIDISRERNIPYLFSGNRFILGKCIKQTKAPVSVIAVLDKQNAEEQFSGIVSKVDQLRTKYKEEFDKRVADIMVQAKASGL